MNKELNSELQQIRELQQEMKQAKSVGKQYRNRIRVTDSKRRIFIGTGVAVGVIIILLVWLHIQSLWFPVSENPQLEPVELIRVVDGDTILVSRSGEEIRVRLLTVKCEESVHPDAERNNAEGEAASAFTKEYLEDYHIVYLQFDEELYDKYNRLLAYVWLEDQVSVDSKEDVERYMFNAILLKEGYAETVVYEPNHRYAEWFYEIEEEAKSFGDE